MFSGLKLLLFYSKNGMSDLFIHLFIYLFIYLFRTSGWKVEPLSLGSFLLCHSYRRSLRQTESLLVVSYLKTIKSKLLNAQNIYKTNTTNARLKYSFLVQFHTGFINGHSAEFDAVNSVFNNVSGSSNVSVVLKQVNISEAVNLFTHGEKKLYLL